MARKNKSTDDSNDGANTDSGAPSAEDSALFRRAVAELGRGGRDYRRTRRPAEESAPGPAARIRARETPLAEHADSAAGDVMLDRTDHGGHVEFARAGLQKKVLRRLKRGDYGFAATLDLHGYTTAEAAPILEDFLRKANTTGDSTLLIIHGKGLHSGGSGGVLKRFTLNWLKQRPEVKAFCSALPRDGGTGAVYVLLRKERARY